MGARRAARGARRRRAASRPTGAWCDGSGATFVTLRWAGRRTPAGVHRHHRARFAARRRRRAQRRSPRGCTTRAPSRSRLATSTRSTSSCRSSPPLEPRRVPRPGVRVRRSAPGRGRRRLRVGPAARDVASVDVGRACPRPRVPGRADAEGGLPADVWPDDDPLWRYTVDKHVDRAPAPREGVVSAPPSEHPRALVARHARRTHPVRSVPARLPARRRPARPVLRARSAQGDAMVLTTYGRSQRLLRSTRSRRSRSTTSTRARASSRSAPRAATSRASSARTGTSRSRARWTRLADRAQPGGDRARGGGGRRDERRVHVQRSGDLRRVRDGRRRRLPRARHQDRRRDGGLHARRAAARSLREDGRGERRPEGVHRGVLREADRLAARPGQETLEYLVHETSVWTEITTLLIPGLNDSERELRRALRVGRERARAPTSRCTSARSIPTTG